MTRLLTIAALALGLSACATQAEVRQACHDHRGVASANGNSMRKFVACRDGHYKTVR